MEHFYSRPCGRGDRPRPGAEAVREDFYSRPCGRGDAVRRERSGSDGKISTHAPAGGATRRDPRADKIGLYFYSRPCGRGDPTRDRARTIGASVFLLTPLREGRRDLPEQSMETNAISTHAPAGGATAVRAERGRQLEYFYSRPCGRGDLRWL